MVSLYSVQIFLKLFSGVMSFQLELEFGSEHGLN